MNFSTIAKKRGEDISLVKICLRLSYREPINFNAHSETTGISNLLSLEALTIPIIINTHITGPAKSHPITGIIPINMLITPSITNCAPMYLTNLSSFSTKKRLIQLKENRLK
jgi:hypothetical protein